MDGSWLLVQASECIDFRSGAGAVQRVPAEACERSEVLQTLLETHGEVQLEVTESQFHLWLSHCTATAEESVARITSLDVLRELWRVSDFLQDRRTCQVAVDAISRLVFKGGEPSGPGEWASPPRQPDAPDAQDGSTSLMLDFFSSPQPLLFQVLQHANLLLCKLLEKVPRSLHGAALEAQALGCVLRLKWQDQDITPYLLQDLLPHVPSLTALSIKSLVLRRQDITQIAQIEHLRELQLNDCVAMFPGMVKLAQALADACTISTLRMHYVMDMLDMPNFAPQLKRLTSLRVLDLEHNHLGCPEAAQLAPALAEMTALLTVRLGHNRFGDAGVALLLPGLSQILGLENLSLPSNELRVKGMEELSSHLLAFSNLRALDLSHNQLRGAGITTLAEGVSCLLHLTQLRVSGTNGGVPCIEALEQLLAARRASLRMLYIAGNELGNDGTLQLSPALAQMSRLEDLDLSENAIGARGMKALMQAFLNLASLRKLSLAQNSIDDQTALELSQHLSCLQALQELHLQDNRISEAILQSFPKYTRSLCGSPPVRR